MTKQVQRRRGTATQHTSFTGAEGEISVNTTNKSVHVHDGVTAGGFEAARADLGNVSDASLNTLLAGNTLSSLTITSADINGGTIDGTVIGGTTPAAGSFTQANFGDNNKAIFGAGSDLQIYHSGSNSHITEAGTGNLIIRADDFRVQSNAGEEYIAADANGAVSLRYDNATKLATTSTGVAVTGDATFADNGKAIFGAGSDLEIYHSGSHSYINEKGTGSLYISGTTGVTIRRNDTSAEMAVFDTGVAKLYYDGSQRLATNSTGVDVTGTVTADGLTVEGTEATFGGASGEYKIIIEGSAAPRQNYIGMTGYDSLVIAADEDNLGTLSDIQFRVDAKQVAKFSGGGDISFYEDTGTTPKFFWDASAERLGIGTSSPDEALEVVGDIKIASSGDFGVLHLGETADQTKITGRGSAHATNPDTMDFAVGAAGTVMRITADGNIGLGTLAPSSRLTLNDTNAGQTVTTAKTAIRFRDSDSGVVNDQPNGSLIWETADTSSAGINAYLSTLQVNTGAANMVFGTGTSATLAERMRIDSFGSLFLAKTSTDIGTVGLEVDANGYTKITRQSATANVNTVLLLNRLNTDGDIIDLRKDGTTVGSIGANGGRPYFAGASSGIAVGGSSAAIWPTNASGTITDNVYDVGSSTVRFDDIYATNGTIQTSDANEKQQIAELTAAEMQAAKAISGLFKTFKWNDSVAEKGDAARIHSGVIAQEVEAAMAEAGLDAGKYAFFISTTWWESTEVIPAVAAVEAVDAVYEDVVIPAVLDEEGNEIEPERTEQRLVSEAIEAVEAQPERTVTHQHETAEEAPEGAVERNRKGIRYPQLLSFIGAATEQRLASIEARLDALEGVN